MADVSFVIVSKAVVEAARPARPRSLYFDLIAEYDHLERNGQSRFTMPPQVVSALAQALREHEVEGTDGRRRRYHASMRTLVEGLRDFGFELLLEDRHQSRILVAIREPQGRWFNFIDLHDALYAQGFTIYPGKPQGVPTFRLSVLGDIGPAEIERFLTALRAWLLARPGYSEVAMGRV